MVRIFFYIVFLLLPALSFGQEEIDSVITIRRSKFFTDIQGERVAFHVCREFKLTSISSISPHF